ncbi:MAG: DUF1700 domain-containing protein [Telluria sp.]
MGKLEYLEQLKRAMLGLPPDVQAKTLGYYEQRFVDGVNAGRSEQDVAGELDDPTRISMTLRANSYRSQLGAQPAPQAGAHPAVQIDNRGPAGMLRLLVSGAGLAIFNLFMIVPAMVYSALLFALYVAALAFYLGGVAITASGLAGNGELVLDLPGHYLQVDDGDDGARRQLRVQIDETGINVHEEGADPRPADSDEPRERSRLRRGASVVAGNAGSAGRLHITTDMDADSRTTQTVVGFGMVLGGIALFLLSLVVTRYTFVGIRRYIQMNFSLLKGH